MTSRTDDIDENSFGDNSLIESVNPLKLVGFINDVLQNILEDPKGSIIDPSASPNNHTPSALKVCSSFASDPAPLVLFILKEISGEPHGFNGTGMFYNAIIANLFLTLFRFQFNRNTTGSLLQTGYQIVDYSFYY